MSDIPNIVQRAKTYAAALKRRGEARIKGEETDVSEFLHKTRLSICYGCEYNIEDRSCGHCGCILEKKTKWATESCPINKW